MNLKRQWLRWRRPLTLAGAVFFVWFGIHSSLIIADGLSDDPDPADIGIVLGNQVNPDRSLSPRLQQRLDKTVDLYRQGRFSVVIVSGGLGKEGYEEAEVMKEYLVSQGIPSRVIIEDRTGFNTLATARRTAQIMREHRYRSALVISQYYHISRCKLAFHKMGIGQVGGVHADFNWDWSDPGSLIREFVGYYSYWIR